VYFCTMKQFLTYWLIAVTLITGVASISVCRSERSVPAGSVTEDLHTVSNTRKAFYNACTLFSATGIMNEQIRLSHSVQAVSFRAISSLLNVFRINHSTQLTQQKFCTGNILFLQKSADKKRDGYYLYYLRKILI